MSSTTERIQRFKLQRQFVRVGIVVLVFFAIVLGARPGRLGEWQDTLWVTLGIPQFRAPPPLRIARGRSGALFAEDEEELSSARSIRGKRKRSTSARRNTELRIETQPSDRLLPG